MSLVAAKCTQCGAGIEVDATKEAGICKFCGTPFITEKVINNYVYNNNYNIGNIENAVIQSGPSEDNLLKRADEFLLRNDLENAREYYNKVLDLNVDNIRAKLGIVDINIRELERTKPSDYRGLIELYKEYLIIDNNDSAKKQKLYYLLMLTAFKANNEIDTKKNAKLLFSEVYDNNPNEHDLNKFFKKYYVGKKVVNYFTVKKIIEINRLDENVRRNNNYKDEFAKRIEEVDYSINKDKIKKRNKINVVNFLVNECGLNYYQAHYFVHNISYDNINVYDRPQNIPDTRPASFPPIKKARGYFSSLMKSIKKGDIVEIVIGVVLAPIALVLIPILKILNIISAIFSPIYTIKRILGMANSDKCYMCEEDINTKRNKVFFTHDKYAFHENCISLMGIKFSEMFIGEKDLVEIIHIMKMFSADIDKDNLKNHHIFTDKIGLFDD